jgi:release factor glutamine methyltransferase
MVGDVGALPMRSDAFDVVTAVAPYVPTAAIALLPADVPRHEPRRALDGGDDGLAVVRRVVAAGARLLRPGGVLLTELGGDQDLLLAPDLEAAGFAPAEPWLDEDGDLRGVVARRR